MANWSHFISLIPYDSPCWICLDKGFSPDVSFASFEMAYTSFKSVSKRIALSLIQNDRIHPTQKPIKLYEWLLQHYAKEGDKILDTHVWSASSLIDCHNMGFDYMGCELDEDYFRMATERLEAHKAQMRLF